MAAAGQQKSPQRCFSPGLLGAALLNTLFWKILVTRVNGKCVTGELSAVGRNRRSRIKLEAFVENLPLMARAYENEEYVRDQIRTNAVEGY